MQRQMCLKAVWAFLRSWAKYRCFVFAPFLRILVCVSVCVLICFEIVFTSLGEKEAKQETEGKKDMRISEGKATKTKAKRG